MLVKYIYNRCYEKVFYLDIHTLFSLLTWFFFLVLISALNIDGPRPSIVVISSVVSAWARVLAKRHD
jgi:hypothetical protein